MAVVVLLELEDCVTVLLEDEDIPPPPNDCVLDVAVSSFILTDLLSPSWKKL